MKKKNNYIIAAITVFVTALSCLILAIIAGKHELWIYFGICISLFIVGMMAYGSVLLFSKIDSCFNRLEKLIREQIKADYEKEIH